MERLPLDMLEEIKTYLPFEEKMMLTDIYFDNIKHLNDKIYLQQMISMKCNHIMKSGKRIGQKCNKNARNHKCHLHR
jgi:hypothetical protein